MVERQDVYDNYGYREYGVYFYIKCRRHMREMSGNGYLECILE